MRLAFICRKTLQGAFQHLHLMSQNGSLQHTSVMFMMYALSLPTTVAHFSVNMTESMAKLLGNNGRIAHLEAFCIAEKEKSGTYLSHSSRLGNTMTTDLTNAMD